MNTNILCSEDEAVKIAGVSSRTLKRFSESGYLSRHANADGTPMFDRSELESIFGQAKVNSVESTYTTNIAVNKPETGEALPQEAPNNETIEPRDFNKSTAATDELARIKNLLTMQERILDAKDDEIADLKSQRAWLRERIEKLEEKGERDQILLLSETQTIRSLITFQESRKSTFRQLLEWTGLVRENNQPTLPHQTPSGDYQGRQSVHATSSRTIEVSKAANGG